MKLRLIALLLLTLVSATQIHSFTNPFTNNQNDPQVMAAEAVEQGKIFSAAAIVSFINTAIVQILSGSKNISLGSTIEKGQIEAYINGLMLTGTARIGNRKNKSVSAFIKAFGVGTLANFVLVLINHKLLSKPALNKEMEKYLFTAINSLLAIITLRDRLN
ncbi:MAG: hypothetical protein WBQ73_01610 [Candidatus Babeliales bacterium]